jgi:hypothetical protein
MPLRDVVSSPFSIQAFLGEQFEHGLSPFLVKRSTRLTLVGFTEKASRLDREIDYEAPETRNTRFSAQRHAEVFETRNVRVCGSECA